MEGDNSEKFKIIIDGKLMEFSSYEELKAFLIANNQKEIIDFLDKTSYGDIIAKLIEKNRQKMMEKRAKELTNTSNTDFKEKEEYNKKEDIFVEKERGYKADTFKDKGGEDKISKSIMAIKTRLNLSTVVSLEDVLLMCSLNGLTQEETQLLLKQLSSDPDIKTLYEGPLGFLGMGKKFFAKK